ncbi:MAG: outer membrane beta-barrel protein [Terracidiphilus sp.]|jgi:hypothetical protein
MPKALVLFLALTCCSILSSAQQPKPAALDKWDVFGGYSYSRAYVGINESPFPLSLNGGQASGSYYFNKYVGATVEFAGYTDSVDSSVKTVNTQGYLAGPSVRFGLGHGRLPRVSFFAHQLFGATHFSFALDPTITDCGPTEESCSLSTNSFTMVSGGGVDIKLRKHISIRPVQMEYFTQQISVFDLVGEEGDARPAAKSFEIIDNPESGIKLSTNGFRYSGGVVVRF